MGEEHELLPRKRKDDGEMAESDQIKETKAALDDAEKEGDVALANVLREKLSDLADRSKSAAQSKSER